MSQLRNNVQKVIDAMDQYNDGKGTIHMLVKQLESLSTEELMVLLIEHPILWCLVVNPSEELLMLKQITS